ncbi:hypothetical protein Btru_012588 [Bulinus truncatus]|nr:hypothetical protein Btru_012588 [Bulinus truncatus]
MKAAMFQLVVLCALCVLSVVGQDATEEHKFEAFITRHGKKYNQTEKSRRFRIWQDKNNLIQEHNGRYQRGLVAYILKENEYMDLTEDEFRKYRTGAIPPQQDQSTITTQSNQDISLQAAPKCSYNSFTPKDYRTQGAVSPVKNQGNCGSCWAFSAVAAIESACYLKNLAMQNVSEQQLVDCSSSYGNNGCSGGWMDNAFSYVIANGVSNSVCYPYTAQTGICSSSNCAPATYIASYVDVTTTDECLMMQALNNHGPLSVALCGSSPSFQMYGGGFYNDTSCNCPVNHAVVIVGWTVANGARQWILKNRQLGYILGVETTVTLSLDPVISGTTVTPRLYPVISGTVVTLSLNPVISGTVVTLSLNPVISGTVVTIRLFPVISKTTVTLSLNPVISGTVVTIRLFPVISGTTVTLSQNPVISGTVVTIRLYPVISGTAVTPRLYPVICGPMSFLAAM